MLKLKNIQSGYGKKQVLFDVSMSIDKGEIVSIIGPNGAGKSTILKVICGAIPVWNGNISFKSKSINKNSISQNIKSGITIAPQGSRVFNELTVRDNLELGGYLLNKSHVKKRVEYIYKVFPLLKERSKQIAGKLSGGEQQMLALARALIPEPKILLLDEPSLGLAPNLLDEVFGRLKELNQDLKVTMLIVEQKVNKVLGISDRTYSVKLGKIAFEGKSTELIGNKGKLKELFL
ncbi:MAG: ATP-binding cassette domain-containing protein [Candidatus Delongbacteria bacterium]|nr:ATP-binding cassette domain-containing protein [Candidatus Delongbacteria bacterium]